MLYRKGEPASVYSSLFSRCYGWGIRCTINNFTRLIPKMDQKVKKRTVSG